MTIARTVSVKILAAVALLLLFSNIAAQEDDPPIRIFGYFQNSFQHWTELTGQPEQNSFSLQQLNLLFQKDLGSDWTAYLNFEFLNNFSSRRQWGSANLEEAWIKYRADNRFNLKLGLLVPKFNNLNDIKNRTPLIPYIIRPLAYESSFSEFIPIDVLAPTQAFTQVYGFFPSGSAKLDYAVYFGNSPNISQGPARGRTGIDTTTTSRTGIDTTTTILVGGRLGVRFHELEIGISGTYDRDNIFESLAAELNIARSGFNELPKTRLGGDLAFNVAGLSVESEVINVDIHKSSVELDADLDFYYATLGYEVIEKLLLYGSYWGMHEKRSVMTPDGRLQASGDARVYSGGVSYGLIERITLKGQYAKVFDEEKERLPLMGTLSRYKSDFSVFALAVSVYF